MGSIDFIKLEYYFIVSYNFILYFKPDNATLTLPYYLLIIHNYLIGALFKQPYVLILSNLYMKYVFIFFPQIMELIHLDKNINIICLIHFHVYCYEYK